MDLYPSDATTTGTLAIGDSIQIEIDTEGDRDWFAVSLLAGNRYSFGLFGVPHVENGVWDTYLTVFDSAGEYVINDDDSGGLYNAQIFDFAPTITGTYFLEAAAYGDYGTGAYLLEASEVTDDIREGVDTDASLVLGTAFSSDIEALADGDWIRVDLEGRRPYEFSADLPLSLTASLLDEDGNYIYDQIESTSGSFGVEVSGTYFLLVGSDNYWDGDIISASNPLDYSVTISEAEPDPHGATFDQATTVEVGIPTAAAIDFRYDVDMFSVPLVEGEKYFLSARSDNYGSRMEIKAFDADNTLIESEDFSYLEDNQGEAYLTAVYTGLHYIQVSSSVNYFYPVTEYDLFVSSADPVNLTGTSGNDILFGGRGDDSIAGAAGNDRVRGNPGNDTLAGDNGDDGIHGGRGNDEISGGLGADNIGGGSGEDIISGGLGNDTIGGGRQSDFISGEEGDDMIGGGWGNDSISGGDGNDSISGGSHDDSITGGSGNDFLNGGSGADFVSGGIGNDLIRSGGYSNDTLMGDEGDDGIRGADGNDQISGGTGADNLSGGYGYDTLSGGSGNDTIGGGGYDDVISGDAGDDLIGGGWGYDQIFLGEGNDTAYGGGGNDLLHGGAGDDVLYGGRWWHDDDLVGGIGNDTMTGGQGADDFTFEFINAGEHDIITDFDAEDDYIILHGLSSDAETDAQALFDTFEITEIAGGVQLNVIGHLIDLQGVLAEDLTIENVLFA